MRTTTATPTRRLADLLLGDAGPLEAFVKERRAQKPSMSWRLIARDLLEATGIDLTGETLRGWFPDEQKRRAS